MKISNNGIELIKKFESFRAVAYKDTAGLWTIGWGHLIKKGEKFLGPISSVQGLTLLLQDLQEAEDCVNRLTSGSSNAPTTITLNQNQFDALVSFTYNLGCGALKSSTLLKYVKLGNFLAAASEFAKWNHNRVNGKLVVVGGLTNRRQLEAQLFLKEV